MAGEGTTAAAAATDDADSFVEQVTDDGQQQQQQQQDGGGAAAAAATPDELKSAMAELAKTVGGLAKTQQPAAQPAKQFTQDEINEFWAVYDPEKSNPDFFKKWMRLAADMDPNEVQSTIAERKALFLDMQKGLMKQAMTGSRNLLDFELQKLREEFGPLREYVSSAKAEKTRERFFTEYPALQEIDEASGLNKFSQVIDAVARTLADKTFDDEKAYFKALAEGAAGAIKGLVPTFDLGAKPKPKTAVTGPRLPRTSVGGTGRTAAGTTGSSEKKSDDDSESLDWMK